MDNELLILRINTLLNHIDEILEDVRGLTEQEFKDNSVVLRATCFSIGQIGEQMTKLEAFLQERYQDLPWKKARGMRNLIVHEYERIDAEQVYSTIVNDLLPLKMAFVAIKNEIENNR